MRKYSLVLIIATLFFGTAAITVNNDKYFEIIKNIEIFTNIFKEINTHYVDEVDPSALMKVGIDAMLETLDPYTNYVSESQIENYRIAAEGRYSGIGAVSKEIDGFVTISEVLEGGAAEQGGLKVGDQLLKVNSRSVEGRSNDDVAKFMRGAQGAEISLTVKRPGTTAPVDLALNRAQVNIPNVPFTGMVSEDIGYISLTTFTQNAGKNIAKALRDLKKNENLKGVILDLRSNGGGLLSEAINICNIFSPMGQEVVFTKGKVIDRDQSYKTRNAPIDLDIPLTVLINKTSASASEIVSGVMQDLDRGVIIGQRSYGKGLVQNTRRLGYNSSVKITTSKYYIPSGRCIQSVEYEDGEPKDIADDKRAKFKTKNGRTVLDGGGVTPDIKIEEPEQPDVLKALRKQNMIFKYVTEYSLKHDSIAGAKYYKFTDYSEFKAFLAKNKFKFDLEGEKAVEEMKENSLENINDPQISAKIAALEKSLTQTKQDDLDEFEALITKEIEKDIVVRYHYQSGRIKQGLQNDKEIEEAISVLRDKSRYEKILSGK